MSRIRVLLLLLASFLLAVPLGFAADWGEVRTPSTRVNLRADRGTDAAIVGHLDAGELVRVALEEGGWAAVFPLDDPGAVADPDHALGYVFASLLTEPTEVMSAPTREEVGMRATSRLPPPASEVEAPPGVSSRREVIFSLASSIEAREKELARQRAALEGEEDSRRMEIKLEAIKENEVLLETLRRRFSQTAAGIDLDPLGDEVGADFEWADELKDLLAPVLQELKRATIRPRELDRLGRERDRLEEQVNALSRALAGADELRGRMDSAIVKREVDALVEEWSSERERASTELAFTTQRLERLRGERTSLTSSVRQISQLFFKSRGRNLLLALAGLVGTVLVLRWLHALIRRLSPLHQRPRGTPVRVFDLAFVFGEALAATLVFLAVLYLTGDWVLLTIASVFLFGVAWASKTAVPRFWQQSMLFLNLGPVRERERVLYDGIPWQVGTIGVYSTLTNPALEGGLLRLPVKLLSDLHSRPFGDTEPWFPTRKGDWVLAGDLHARVVVQTPEVVTVVQLGGARTSFPASDFVSLAPRVLSTGFRLRGVFGVDYQHQAISTKEIPDGLRAHLQEGLERMKLGDDIVKLTCELGSAGASSLDVEVILDMKGDAAPRYAELKRAVQRLCVEACNEQGWVIPFQQVTVHMA